MLWHRAFIAMGTNLGDKLQNCRNGLAQLRARDDIQVVACSKFYKTAPLDYLDQDWFINLMAELRTTLAPPALLQRLQSIQWACGRREKGIPFGPRVLDLDIIFYDDLIMQTPDLTIPHPRMQYRRFVLQPLCDLNADLLHPLLQQRVGALLASIVDDQQTIEEYQCD